MHSLGREAKGDLWPVEHQGQGLAKEGTDVVKNVRNLCRVMVLLQEMSAKGKSP